MITATCYTPAGLEFDAAAHRYRLKGRPLLHVTGALVAAGLVDRAWFTEVDRDRGSRIHAAIERYHTHDADAPIVAATDQDPHIAPYLRAYRRFLAESAFRVDACEERLADLDLRVAGTLDLRGQFINHGLPGADRIDVIDVKSGSVPPWVGYQTAGYVRLLPPEVRSRCRRWALGLRPDGRYTLIGLQAFTDEGVFMAAVTVAQAKAGML